MMMLVIDVFFFLKQIQHHLLKEIMQREKECDDR